MADKPKRKRRTVAELIRDGYYANKDKVKTKSSTTKVKPTEEKTEKPKEPKGKTKKRKDQSALFVGNGLTVEEVCDKSIEKAKQQGLDNWSDDFRNDYEKGQRVYYVAVNELCHTKEVLELYVGTVYAKAIILWVSQGYSYTVGIEDKDKIFRSEKEAKKYYKKVRV